MSLAEIGSSPDLHHAWEVLLLYVIPVGGGIPAGVVLAAKYGFAWPFMAFLYLISDILLALVFEPLMLWFLAYSEKSPRASSLRQAFAESTRKTVARAGVNPGPMALILIAFGTDPMTGRSVAKAKGHGFLSGWAIAIAGDMIFFFILMASTLWLNDVLGDGTWAALIVTVATLFLPGLIRRLRGVKIPSSAQD